jgi:penicillin G amidase
MISHSSLPAQTRRASHLGIVVLLGLIAALGSMAGCGLFAPLPEKRTVAERVQDFPADGLPIREPVSLYWDSHLVPFIEAQRDDDLAFVLGMVHAHLRLGQMEMIRHVSQGRLAEMLGPSAAPIDYSLRILNVGRASAEIYRGMPPETRLWLDEFVRGVNVYQDRLRELPHEFKVMGLGRERWTPEDIITMERFAGADVNWVTEFLLLPIRGKPYYREVFEKFRDAGSASMPSFAASDPAASLSGALGGLSRSGSNALALSAWRSATRGAILAGDPHVAIMIPNSWIIVGCHSPSYHVVGLMFPGVPFVAIGRNEHVAWGGTNMRAASSDFYDLSAEPTGAITSRQEKIRVRWWFNREVTVRESRLGPVISDAPELAGYRGPPLALRWVGHEPSDEFTALLKANRARNWDDFREAFRGYGVPGMNILFADDKGDIGQLMAVRAPVRPSATPEDVVVNPADPARLWQGFKGPCDLPQGWNPQTGFLASCNNLPAKSNPPVGWLYSPNDRVARISALVGASGKISLDQVKAIQSDVYSATDSDLRDLFLRRMTDCGVREELESRQPEFMAALAAWDGCYNADSVGAVAFQTLLYHFADAYYTERYDKSMAQILLKSAYAREFLKRDMAEAPSSNGPSVNEPAEMCALFRDAAARAVESAKSFRNWGEMHRLQLAHVFSVVPHIGEKYRLADYPAAGANETLLKTAHPLTAGKNAAVYGAVARAISDLSNPEENYFVLLGGQDGRLRSDASLDQVPLWLSRQYIKVPLPLESVRKSFEFRVALTPEK